MALGGSPALGGLSSAGAVQNSLCAHQGLNQLPQGTPTGSSVLQEQDQWGSNAPELNQPGVCLFLQSQLCWPWTQIPRADIDQDNTLGAAKELFPGMSIFLFLGLVYYWYFLPAWQKNGPVSSKLGRKAGFLKLLQQLLGESTAILTKVDENKDFTQVVNWELLHWLCLS